MVSIHILTQIKRHGGVSRQVHRSTSIWDYRILEMIKLIKFFF